MKTMFNQDLIKVSIKESGGNVEYDYSYFKDGFEEWAKRHDASLPDLENLKEYIVISGYRVIEITEKTHIDELVEGLKDLIGKEFTLLEMDGWIQYILYDIDESGTSSIFDGETRNYIEDGQYSYTVWTDDKKEDTADINVCFEVLDLNEDNLETTVKITDIEEL